MPDLAQAALRYALMSIAVASCAVIALILIDCLSRIALGCGLIE